jgi:hypothetical protein
LQHNLPASGRMSLDISAWVHLNAAMPASE